MCEKGKDNLRLQRQGGQRRPSRPSKASRSAQKACSINKHTRRKQTSREPREPIYSPSHPVMCTPPHRHALHPNFPHHLSIRPPLDVGTGTQHTRYFQPAFVQPQNEFRYRGKVLRSTVFIRHPITGGTASLSTRCLPCTRRRAIRSRSERIDWFLTASSGGAGNAIDRRLADTRRLVGGLWVVWRDHGIFEGGSTMSSCVLFLEGSAMCLVGVGDTVGFWVRLRHIMAMIQAATFTHTYLNVSLSKQRLQASQPRRSLYTKTRNL
jgi:hypothetical protein